MNNALLHWRTTIVGVAAAGLLAAAAYYKPGMSWRDWAAAALVGLLGVLAKDAKVAQ